MNTAVSPCYQFDLLRLLALRQEYLRLDWIDFSATPEEAVAKQFEYERITGLYHDHMNEILKRYDEEIAATIKTLYAT